MHEGRFTEPADAFAHPFWNRVRGYRLDKAIGMRRQGFFGAAMLPMAELEYTGIMENLKALEPRFRVAHRFVIGYDRSMLRRLWGHGVASRMRKRPPARSPITQSSTYGLGKRLFIQAMGGRVRTAGFCTSCMAIQRRLKSSYP